MIHHRSALYARSGTRRLGEVDSLDIVLGLGLLVLLPTLSYFLASVWGTPEPKDPYAFGEKPLLNPPPDAEEVDARWRQAAEIYSANAKYYLDAAADTKNDEILREHFRVTARRCLESARAELTKFNTYLAEHKGETQFAAYLAKSAEFQKDILEGLKRVKSLDVLGRDERR